MSGQGTLAGRHALVCGASQGIGRATAAAIGSLGANLTILARSSDALNALREELSSTVDGDIHVLVADLDQREELQSRVSDHIANHGPVHILINNTGGPPGGPLLQADEGALLTAFGRHVLSAHLLTKTLLPGMQAAGYGRIINVLSTSVREPIPNLGVSNIIRAAMANWAKTLSRELPAGVTINNILPGYTDTTRLSQLGQGVAQRTGQTTQQVHENWVSQIPEGRLGTPEELAGAIAFLASPAASYIRGVSLPVDGGRLRST